MEDFALDLPGEMHDVAVHVVIIGKVFKDKVCLKGRYGLMLEYQYLYPRIASNYLPLINHRSMISSVLGPHVNRRSKIDRFGMKGPQS